MKILNSLALMAFLAGPVAAQDNGLSTPPPPKPDHDEALAESEPLTRGLAGPYLAARTAALNEDFTAAADYYRRALQQGEDNPYLVDSTLVASVSAGDFDQAVALAARLMESGHATDLSRLVSAVALVKTEDWQALLDLLAASPQPQMGQQKLLDGMMRAWADLGSGRATDALADFQALEAIPGAAGIARYHLALAKAKVGDFEGAEALLSQGRIATHILGLHARAEILAQLDQRDAAIRLIEETPGTENEPSLLRLVERLKSGEPITFDQIRDPRDGIAQSFLTFADALATSEEPSPLALIHARLAGYLVPDMGEARLMVAQMLMSMEQYDAAEREFDALRDLGDMRPIAELSRIDTLARAERMADAEKAALSLTEARPEFPQGWIALGDLLRQQEKFTDSIPPYDRALTLIGDDRDGRWYPLFSRGISYERSGQFPKAVADFREALEIRPDQASVLNYLGYSYVDRGENLDEGLKLIERAVARAPNDAYIQDSLAWAYYRLGRYAEAVPPMERAARDMSDDPLINDHLGDIYWKVGRKREAEIQWKRALSLGPETPAETFRVRAKLGRGLDAVLAEEEANGGKLPMPPEPVEDKAPGE